MSFVGTTSEAEGETRTPPLVSTPGPSSNLFSTLWPTACTGANHYTPNPPRLGGTYPAGAPGRGPRACAKKPATPELSFDATVQDADGALRGIADSLLDLQQSLEELEKASSTKAACHDPSASQSLRASPHAFTSPSASISVPLTSWSSSPHQAGCDNSGSVDVQVELNLQSVVQDKIRAVDEHLSVVTLDLKLLDRLLTNKLRHLPPPTLKEREDELRDVAEKFTAVDAEFRSLEKHFLLLKAKTSADSPALRKRQAAGTSSVSEPNPAGPTRAQTLFERLENRRLEREQREQSKEAAAPAEEEDRLVAREQDEEKDHDDEMFGGGSRRVFSVFSPARFEEYGDLVHDNLSPESLTAHTPMTVTDRLQPPLSGRGHGGGHGKTSPEERHPESELKPRGNILSGNALSEGEELPEDADPARAPLRADRLRFLSSLANSQSASECSSSSGEVQLEDANADEHEASILEQQWEVEEDAESLVRMQRTLDDTRPSGGDGGGGQRGGSRAIGQETKKVNQHAWDNDNLASTVDAAEDDSSGATYSSSSAMQTGDEADDHEGRTHKDDHEKKLHEHEAAAGVLRSAFSVPYCSSGESTIIGGHATASDIENEVVATPAVARDPFEDAVDDAGAEAEAEADGCSPLTPSSIARGEEQFFPTQCFPVVPTAARPADGPAAPRPKLEHEKQIERASATTPEEQLVQTLTNLPEMLESRIEGVGLGLEKLQGTLSSGLERAKKKVASGSDGLLHTMADGLTKGLLFVSTAGEADEAEVQVASTTVPASPAPDHAEIEERSVSQATSTTAATATATTAYGYDSSLPLVEAAQKAEDEIFRREVLSPTRKNTGKLFRSPSRTDHHVRRDEGGFGLIGSVGKGNTPKCLEDDDDHRPEKKAKCNYPTTARDILAAATRNEDLSGAKHHNFSSPAGMQQSPLSSFHGTPVVEQPLLRMLKEEHRGNEMNSDNAPEETPSPGHRSSVPLSAKRFGGPASKAERRTADTGRRSPHTADSTFSARPGAPSSSSSSKLPLLQNYSPSPKHNKTTRTRTVTGFSPKRSANKRGSPLSAQLGGSSDRKSRASRSRNKNSSRGHVAIEDDDHPDERHLKKLPSDLVQIELASMRLQQQNKDLHELDRLTDKLECQAREIKRELSEQADLMNDLEHQNGGAGDIGAAFAADSRGANFDAERTSTRNFSFASSGNMMIPSLRELQDTMSAQIHRMQRWLEDRSAENEAEEWTCLWMSQMFVARFVVDENNQPHTLRMLCGVFVVSSILLLRAYVL
mmetsp:Transcript_20858/g.52649  ORF Transcript_20858/g.52649 Transcript_20858/m.52649 type:complete len:1273 (+) Transcript_20858:80-3898(+)